jgi:hypothetical protein
MRNRFSPASALTLGLCLATMAFGLWSLQTTALDQGPVHRDAREVLEESTVHQSMVNRVAAAVALNSSPSDPATLAVVAAQTVAQPEFVEAFAGALDQVQEHVVKGATGPITLDPTLVTQAIAAAAAGQPQLGSALNGASPINVSVSDEQVPNLEHWADLWEIATRALAFFGLLLITYGLLRIEHRVWAFGRIGRWLMVVGVGTLVMFWLLPRVLLRPLGGWIGVAGAVVEAGEFLVPIALGLIAVGAVAAICAHRWEAHDRQRTLSVIPRNETRSGATPSRWESPV